MKVLVVGGTADGRHLATKLFELGFEVIYSIAGIVRKAKVPGPLISGGFTQFGGLQQYITDNQITHIVDATHPFAQKMSNAISAASEALIIPAIRFHRPQWPKTRNDNWVEVTQWSEVIEAVVNHSSVFITAGQITQDVLTPLAAQAEHVLLRTAMPVKIDLPENVTWLKAIGPFQFEDEVALLVQYKIDAIISKNSGGDATYAKIKAAASKGIPVYQFKRPSILPTQYHCENQVSCLALLQKFKLSLDNGFQNGLQNEI